MRILRPSRLASPIGRWWMFRKLLKCLCYGVVLGISVNPLYLRDVVGDGLSGTGAFGIPSLISLDPLPQTETANVALQDACAEFDVVLNLEQVDAFLIGFGNPNWEMGFHYVDRIAFGNGKRSSATPNNHNTSPQSRVD